MKLLAILSISTILFSCGVFKKNHNDEENTEQAQIEKAVVAKEIPEGDFVTISNATLDGNVLSIEVSYSGGCDEHDFQLYGSMAVMKSMPPKRAIKLVHNANGDSCRELKEETLMFDISDLAMSQTAGSEIVLLLDGYKEPINYKYE